MSNTRKLVESIMDSKYPSFTYKLCTRGDYENILITYPAVSCIEISHSLSKKSISDLLVNLIKTKKTSTRSSLGKGRGKLMCLKSRPKIKSRYCDICKEPDVIKRAYCRQCKSPYCIPCYIDLFREGQGVIKCPFCPFSYGNKMTLFEVMLGCDEILSQYPDILEN
jgi:hypothetical protein